MQSINSLDLLTLLVALSAYVATVRLVVIGRLGATGGTSKSRANLRWLLVALLLADVPLIIAATLWFLDTFWESLFNQAPPSALPEVAIWFFFAAAIVLVLHHVFAWFRTVLGVVR